MLLFSAPSQYLHALLRDLSLHPEKSVSELKHIKTVLRSSMSNERLSSLTLLHMHQGIPTDIEEVIDEFPDVILANSTF